MSTVKSKNLNTFLLSAFSGSDNYLTIPKPYIYIAGNLEKAMVLNQIVFWSNKSTHYDDGWFYKPYNEWQEETSICERTMRRIFKDLEDKGFCETKVKKVNGITLLHLRPCLDNISDALHAILSPAKMAEAPRPAKMADPEKPKSPISSPDKMADSLYTDQYTENNIHTLGDGVKTPSPKAKKPYEKNKRFMEFYNAYPKKEKPHDAFKAFMKLNPDDELLAHIIADVKAKTAKHDQWKERQYIPQPSRYLNSGDYESEIINNHDDRKKKEAARIEADKKAAEERALASQRAADMERENNLRKQTDAHAFRNLTERAATENRKPRKFHEIMKEHNALATNGTKTVL